MPMDPLSTRQYVVRWVASIDDVELVHHHYWSYIQLKVNMSYSKGGHTFKSCNLDSLLPSPIPKNSRNLKDGERDNFQRGPYVHLRVSKHEALIHSTMYMGQFW